MGKISSKLAEILGRLLKVAMAAVLVPLAIGLLGGMLGQLELISAGAVPVRRLLGWGFATYVGIHLLLYRPVALFQASHRMFSALAVWLFGGQVASTEDASAGKAKPKGKAKTEKGGAKTGQSSTLVAFSPYVIPSYMVLVCALAWALRHWIARAWIDAPAAVLIGMALAFHWAMTADDLQPQRAQWHIETYLLAVSLIFILTMLVGGACLPWALPEFSFVSALADGYARAQAIYAALVQQLFL